MNHWCLCPQGILELVLLSGFLWNGHWLPRADQGQGEHLCPENLTGASVCAALPRAVGTDSNSDSSSWRGVLFSKDIVCPVHSNFYLQMFSFYLIEENANFSLSKY